MITCKKNTPVDVEVRWTDLLENLGQCPDKVVRNFATGTLTPVPMAQSETYHAKPLNRQIAAEGGTLTVKR